MPVNQVLIQFNSLHQLWQFARRIQCVSMDINTHHKTLLCDCSEQDMELVPAYMGKVLKLVENFAAQR